MTVFTYTSLRRVASPTPRYSTMNIVFIHPDLGIGGAERLIVDAAVGLQNLGHKVTIFTNHCHPAHCFEEARDGMCPPFGHVFCCYSLAPPPKPNYHRAPSLPKAKAVDTRIYFD